MIHHMIYKNKVKDNQRNTSKTKKRINTGKNKKSKIFETYATPLIELPRKPTEERT